MPSSANDFLQAVLRRRVSDAPRLWLERAIAAASEARRGPLLNAYTAASSRVGCARLAFDATEEHQAHAVAPDLPFDRWGLEDAARAMLLLTHADGLAGDADAFVAAALDCYEQGDSGEQQSWLRAVSLLPYADRLLPSVVDACRTNILPVFESVACENPYPARHFPERNFNQMVLKVLFNNVALARIVGLPGRLNPELTRMALDYASERRAAGRFVPSDISLAIARHVAPEPSL